MFANKGVEGLRLKRVYDEAKIYYYLVRWTYQNRKRSEDTLRKATMEDIAEIGTFKDMIAVIRTHSEVLFDSIVLDCKIKRSNAVFPDCCCEQCHAEQTFLPKCLADYITCIKMLRMPTEILQETIEEHKTLKHFFKHALKRKGRTIADGKQYQEPDTAGKRVFRNIDERGRITLPKEFREKLKIRGFLPIKVPLTLDDEGKIAIGW